MVLMDRKRAGHRVAVTWGLSVIGQFNSNDRGKVLVGMRSTPFPVPFQSQDKVTIDVFLFIETPVFGPLRLGSSREVHGSRVLRWIFPK